jgi:hypothetical protein
MKLKFLLLMKCPNCKVKSKSLNPYILLFDSHFNCPNCGFKYRPKYKKIFIAIILLVPYFPGPFLWESINNMYGIGHFFLSMFLFYLVCIWLSTLLVYWLLGKFWKYETYIEKPIS